MPTQIDIDEETEERETVCCDNCGQTFLLDDAELTTVYTRSYHRINRYSEQWCDDCRDEHAFYCHDCEEYYSERDVSSCSNSDNDQVCERCGENYFTCESCEHTYHQDNYGGDGQCDSCYQDPEDTDGISDYSSDAPHTKLGHGPYFYGVELEVEKRERSSDSLSESAEACLNLLNKETRFAIAKSDGSLYNGFELVTCPATLALQIKHWTPFFEKRPRGIKSFNTSTCGLHVHASREHLNELTIAKVVCFVNANANRRFVSVIAGRESSSWASYHEKKLGDGNKRNSQRYEAVNLQNDETIEFRIFKGTLKRESVFKAIEFCDALIHYCLPATRSLADSQSRAGFIAYVKANGKLYPNLLAFIEAKWEGKETERTKAAGYSPSDNQEEYNQGNEEI